MFETERCVLKVLDVNDYENIKKLYVNKDVRKFLGGTIEGESYKLRFHDLLNGNSQSHYWTVYLKDNSEFIGLVFLEQYHDDVNQEIGYQFLPEFWGKGYAKEAVERVLSYGFNTLKWSTIVAETQSVNSASLRLLKRMGMKLEGKLIRFGEEQSKFSLCASNFKNDLQADDEMTLLEKT